MKKHVYLIIISITIIVVGCVCYFSIYKGNKTLNTVAKKTEENIIENTVIQNENIEKEDDTTTENVIENNIVNNEIVNETNKTNDIQIANKSKANTNNNQAPVKVTTPIAVQENKKQEQSPQEQAKNELPGETKTEEIKQETPIEEPKTVQLDFSKYDRYYSALNGGYTCFKKNSQEMTKLRGLLESAIQEFGYTNIKLVEDSSLAGGRYFTANKTNAQNAVYNAEDCAIHYYAETEYTLSKDGKESVFQIRSYTKLTGQ